MSIKRAKDFKNVNITLKNGKWKIDNDSSEFLPFPYLSNLEYALRDQNAFLHFYDFYGKKILYAMSCAVYYCGEVPNISSQKEYKNELKIELFEVNKPFRRHGVGKFAIYELLKQYPTITNVELDSISPEADKFFESLKMQREINRFTGDATWLSNFTTSMTNENKNDIIKIIDSICNHLSN